jgi:hypothetical protein
VTALVHIGITEGAAIVSDYYQMCQRETLGGGQIETGAIRTFGSLEGLLDGIIASPENTHVVVCHGNPQQGLLTPFTTGSPHNATGLMVGALTALVRALQSGTLPPFDPTLVNAASQMGIDPVSSLRLVGKLMQVSQRGIALHFRACNLGNSDSMARAYKAAFGAGVVTAPKVRMLYIRINPGRPGPGVSIVQLSNQSPTTPPGQGIETRRRVFFGGALGPLLIDVRDINGHTNVNSPLTLLDQPAQASQWATVLLNRWTGPAGVGFVLPIMWGDRLTDGTSVTYHCPLEVGYRERLTFV